MTRGTRIFAVLAVAGLAATGTPITGSSQSDDLKKLKEEERLALIRTAEVWKPIDIKKQNLRLGPQRPKGFQPFETVACDYSDEKLGGASPKFACAMPSRDEEPLKVKYGSDNGEVYAEVAATRLLWALGFGADHIYPVKIVCRNCPVDPAKDAKDQYKEVVFDPAAVEIKMPGKTVETSPDSGWSWSELDEGTGRGPAGARGALKLLAVMLQHTDNKPAQQRLVCLPGGEAEGEGICTRPFMMLNDVGLTFGHSNAFNRNPSGSVNFENWSTTPVWKEAEQCIANLPTSVTGTLNNPKIYETGRAFLASLLVQLSDQQLQDLFDVARFERRSGVSSQRWVEAFREKRDQITGIKCPA